FLLGRSSVFYLVRRITATAGCLRLHLLAQHNHRYRTDGHRLEYVTASGIRRLDNGSICAGRGMKKRILILEQQSWSGGAQRVLEVVLSSLTDEFDPIVAFPDDGSFSMALHEQGIATCTFPLGTYRPGKKSYPEMF